MVARYILMERFAEDAGLLAKVRDYLAKNAVIVSKVIEGKETEGAKFQDYFDHQELLKKCAFSSCIGYVPWT
ncbi:transcriptional accessory protein [Haemophilus influenzae]|uniref:Transcriptional accessory protein n=1 Tax=Haemophilus influenzae TaxID=727 RepID=A0A2X1PK98_HAEIF|nr:transcriptional accessory protein [Haemophilus influenzae]